MSENITAFVGLDVHKGSIAIAVVDLGRGAPRFIGTTGPRISEVKKALSHLGARAELLIVYEAGPCGYVLARQLRERGFRCELVAPTKVPRKPGDRIKTDRRDALSLAQFARAGGLTPVMVPDESDEAIRDLSRAREDALRARMVARHQLKALLLRHGPTRERARGLLRTNASLRILASRTRLNTSPLSNIVRRSERLTIGSNALQGRCAVKQLSGACSRSSPR